MREFRWYRGRRHYSGWYYSSTMVRHVVYESRLELARIMLADQDPDVVGIVAQSPHKCRRLVATLRDAGCHGPLSLHRFEDLLP